MICIRCQTPNPDDSQFCRNCAAPLPVAPPQGQAAPPPGSPYGFGGNQPGASPGFQPQQNYGGFAGGQPVSAGASGRAITSMILSILSVLTCCLFLGVPGLILGKMEMTAISQGRASQAGRTFAMIGFWAGIVGTVFSLGIVGLQILSAMMGGGGYGYGYPY